MLLGTRLNFVKYHASSVDSIFFIFTIQKVECLVVLVPGGVFIFPVLAGDVQQV